jgi:prepilin signal peptidase PulO-like enzyme (type II secretory pathway)
MEPVHDFETFYSLRLLPYLEKLKEQRNEMYNWKMLGILSAVGIFLFFVSFQTNLISDSLLLVFFSFVVLIVSIYFYTKRSDQYLDSFKEKVIGQIITALNPTAVYKPMGFVSQKKYRASGLYRRKYTQFDGDDYWEGVYKNVPFHCSEIETRYEDSSGDVQQIFKGLFFSARLNSSFKGRTYVWAKGEEQLPVSVADEHYRMLQLPDVYKFNMGDVTFHKYFSVYGLDASEAAYIIDPPMMQHMLRLKAQLHRKIVFSFVAGRCYVAVPIQENLLEPNNRDIADKETIKTYFFTILLVFNIINELELNRLT